MSKNSFYALFLLVTLAVATSAQTLYEKKFQSTNEAEATLDLTASAPGASWIEKGKEAATAKVYLDGNYQQDITLFAGDEKFTYNLMLGRVAAGEHQLRLELNREMTAPQVSTIKVENAKVALIDRMSPEYLAFAHTPVLYARPNTIGKFSDLPLLMYYEIERRGGLTTLRYSVIFSNEDGGTQTSALMARWGRTTDIEWVLETQIDAQGKVVKSTYQGINHETKEFKGRSEANHPWIFVATDNNVFSDEIRSQVRFAPRPIFADLTKASRETVMDRFPWTYRIMSQEMIREGKIVNERSLGARIADLRSYLYLDANSKQQNGAAISFAVKLKGKPNWYASDLGIPSYKVERSGYYRTTIRLPLGTGLDQIERIAVKCDLTGNPRSKEEIEKAAGAQCDLGSVDKIFLLDEKYQPGKGLKIMSGGMTLPYGEMAVLQGECTSQN
jgi:hypothetical protein